MTQLKYYIEPYEIYRLNDVNVYDAEFCCYNDDGDIIYEDELESIPVGMLEKYETLFLEKLATIFQREILTGSFEDRRRKKWGDL